MVCDGKLARGHGGAEQVTVCHLCPESVLGVRIWGGEDAGCQGGALVEDALAGSP
jgi:hypothetical protein